MNVSAIGPVSASQIDWRRLTAKEILEYDAQGVEVPDQYLQWAKSFQEDLTSSDKDETTYEMAQAAGATQNTNQQSTVESENPENPENLSANQKAFQMASEGAGYFTIARELAGDSKIKAGEAGEATKALEDLGKRSDDAISALDGYMSDLLAKTDELKSQIESKIANANNKEAINEVKSLQRQLEQCGISGQNTVAVYDMDLKQCQAEMESFAASGESAIDYGSVTKEMGSNIKKLGGIVLPMFGHYVEAVGKMAIGKGSEAADAFTEASGKNSQNLSDIVEYARDIKDVTGVSSVDVSDNEQSEEEKQKKQQEELGVSNGSASFDTVVQAKIKQGVPEG